MVGWPVYRGALGMLNSAGPSANIVSICVARVPVVLHLCMRSVRRGHLSSMWSTKFHFRASQNHGLGLVALEFAFNRNMFR